MRVLTIIVSYNFEKWIDRCLGSLLAAGQLADTIVIDNHSTDNTVEIIRQKYPKLQLIVNEQNLGFGQANNIGLKLAIQRKYEGAFLLNQDAWVEANTIQTLYETSQRHPCFGILSPVHLTGSGDKIEHGFAVYSKIQKREQLHRGEDVVEIPFINAAFWYIPTSVLRAIGGFSPLFYHYGEDKDYANRLVHAGYKIGYSPDVFAYHDREDRKVSHQAFLHSEEIYFLTEYANINYSFGSAFGYGVLAGIKKGMKKLCQGKTADAGAYMKISLDLLRRTSEVCRYRRQDVREGANYLQL